jgi:hypothetical protein
MLPTLSSNADTTVSRWPSLMVIFPIMPNIVISFCSNCSRRRAYGAIELVGGRSHMRFSSLDALQKIHRALSSDTLQ